MILISTLLFAIAFGLGLLAFYQILVRDRDPVVTRLRDLRARALAARPSQVEGQRPFFVEILAALGGFMPTGGSPDALRRLARRTGVEDIYSLTAMLIQADKLGTSIAQSLRAHAESMRTKRRQRAEPAARKAGIKLAFPLLFLIFPALLPL